MQLIQRHRGFLLLLLVTVAAFARLWWVEFSWDDEALIVDNQVTGSLANIREFFTRDLWGTTRIETLKSGYYRPFMLLSLALDRALFGLSSAQAHIHSLLWHLGAVTGLYAVLTRLLDRRVALVGAAVFAVHPVQSEVLALVAARNDSMAAAFSLWALYLVLDREVPTLKVLAAAGLLLAGLLSKESAVLAPVILVGLDLARWRRPGDWGRYAGLAGAVLVYGCMRWLVDVDSGIIPAADSWKLIAEHAHEIAGLYGSLLVWPWPLTPARHVHYLPAFAWTAPGLLVLLGLIVLALWKGRNRLMVLAGLVWAVMAFVPSLAATLDKGLLGERYLYLAVAGLSLALAAALPRVPRGLVPAIVAISFVVLQIRLPHWEDSRAVWTEAHEVAPTPFTAAGLAWYQHRDGDLDEAIPLFVQALEGDPPYRDACDLIVRAYLEDNRVAEAVEIGRWALQERGCNPGSLIGHDYAIALAGNGDWDEAVRVARNRPGGLSGAGLVVMGGQEARTGDLKAVDQLSTKWGDRIDYFKRVIKLLELSGETAAAQRLSQALQAATARQGAQ